MSSRGNDGLVNTDNTDEILQTNLHTPERLRLQHGSNLPRTLPNRHEKYCYSVEDNRQRKK